MMIALHFLREGDLFLDIGANVGSFTVLASGVCRANTWSFEPDPGTAGHLRRNIAVNGIEGLVTVHQCALGPTEGETHFTVGRDCMNKVAAPGDGNVRVVRQEPLDKLVGAAQPIMIKMDVEGYEEEVPRGAQALLANPCLKVIELETVSPACDSMLLRNGFERAYYDPFSRRLAREPVDSAPSNALHVRDRAFVEARMASAPKIEILGRSI